MLSRISVPENVHSVKQNKSMEYLKALSMIIPLAESKLIGKRQGPQPVLRKDEELYLVNWAVEMNKIGYGQTRRQICEMVKKNLRQGGQTKPFQR